MESKLLTAARENNSEEILRLLPHTHRVNDALVTAAEHGAAEAVRVLLSDPRVEPDYHDNIAVVRAAVRGHATVVYMLMVDERVNPAARNNVALAVAARDGLVGTVRILLLDPRVDPGARNAYPLRAAAFYGRAEVVKVLLQHATWRPTHQLLEHVASICNADVLEVLDDAAGPPCKRAKIDAM